MGSHDFTQTHIPTSSNVDEAEEREKQRRAMLQVAAHSESREECEDFLKALGLIKPGFHWVKSSESGNWSYRTYVEGDAEED